MCFDAACLILRVLDPVVRAVDQHLQPRPPYLESRTPNLGLRLRVYRGLQDLQGFESRTDTLGPYAAKGSLFRSPLKP